MIVVKLMGGLGNQMFQYAFGKRLSIESNVELRLDKSFLSRRDLGENFTYRNYDLDIFNIDEKFDIPQLNGFLVKEPHFHYSENLCSQLLNICKTGKDVFLEGYWQSEKYFKNIDLIIRNCFQLKQELIEDKNLKILDEIKNHNSVMINVRRSDYLNTNFHGVMSIDYFNEAKKIVKSKLKNVKFFVFSDDIPWCLENLKSEDSVIVDHSHAGYKFSNYLKLMSECKHFIIPNSSFAWWSVYLSNNQEKIVISPKNWFSHSSGLNYSDLYCEGWVKL